MFSGPNAPVGHGSLTAGLGWTADYIAKWILKIAEEDIKWVDVKEDVTQEFNAYGDQIMQTLIWSSPCKSWYKNSNDDDDMGNGRIKQEFQSGADLTWFMD